MQSWRQRCEKYLRARSMIISRSENGFNFLLYKQYFRKKKEKEIGDPDISLYFILIFFFFLWKKKRKKERTIHTNLEIDIRFHVGLQYWQSNECVFRGKGNRMMNGMIPFPKFSCYSDDRCHTLMRNLMATGTSGYLQIGVTIEPDLLELSHKVRDVFASMQVSTDVKCPKL